MKGQRILVVLYYYRPYLSGLSEYARRLSEGLVRRGHEVTVLCSRHGKELPLKERINGVEVIRVPVWLAQGKGVVAPALTWRTVHLARRYDLVNLHLPLAEAGVVVSLLPREKVVLTYHCDVNLGNGLLNRWIQSLAFVSMRLSMRRAGLVIGNSRAYFDASKMGDVPVRFRQVYPPVETRQFVRRADVDLRERYGISSDAFIIGFVGRIVHEKGLDVLFAAIPDIEAQVGPVMVLVAGESEGVRGGSVREALSEYERHIPGRIVFVGKLTEAELRDFYSGIDVLVLPSIDPLESFGMVQVEAMSCGTPVVASNLPGVNEVVTRTGFGALAEPGDAADLARKVATVLQRDGVTNHFIKRDWDVESTVDQYENALREIGTAHS